MKRLSDIIGSLFGLLLLSPVMIGMAILIKATSSGPALFSQMRVGRHGRLFRVYKFRSMVSNAEQLGTSVTTAVDRRITPIGRLLRRSKLDELPQLWNVLTGEMSLIGPRPDVPEIVEAYSGEMRRILDIRPGITSIATLYLRDEESLLATSDDPDRIYNLVLVPFKVALAMEHVERDSFFFDTQVLMQTVWALTIGRFFPDPNRELVEIVQRDILDFHAEDPESEPGRAAHNWKRYRQLIRRSLEHLGRKDRPHGRATFVHHSSTENP